MKEANIWNDFCSHRGKHEQLTVQWYCWTLRLKWKKKTIIFFVQENIPYAVVGTDKEHQVNGNKVLGRKTKWGIIEGKLSVSHLV